MNISCIICSDLFIPSADIYATKCGHLFHHNCVLQWLERSASCPQCRNKTTEKSIYRVFLNIQTGEDIKEDSVTLQAHVDSLKFKVKILERDQGELKEKLSKAELVNKGLRDEVRKAEQAVRVQESMGFAFKEQIKYFKSKSQESDKLQAEVKKLQDKITNMQSLELALNGTKEQVEDMLRSNRDAQSLAILVASLKKELLESERHKRHMSSKNMQLKNELEKVKRDYEQQKKKIEENNRDIEEHAECAKEKRYLKQKLCELQEKTNSFTPNKSLMRVLNESPAPKRHSLNDAIIDLNDTDSPALNEKVRKINDSDSPYLQHKPNNGLNGLLNAKFSLVSKPTVPQSPSFTYDGLGGHSKAEIFPQPIRPSNTYTLKRPKTSSTATSQNKFRKLSNQANAFGKIDDWFNKYN